VRPIHQSTLMVKRILITTIFTIYINLTFSQTIKDTIYPIDYKCSKCLDTALVKTSDMMNCFAIARDSWEKEMTKYYNKLMALLNPEQKQVLIAAQATWQLYKDKEFELCTSIYYDKGKGREKRIDAASRQSEIFRQRTLDLMQYCDLYLEK
jgi:uncharacterized protein YecT (DUF1311 family)